MRNFYPRTLKLNVEWHFDSWCRISVTRTNPFWSLGLQAILSKEREVSSVGLWKWCRISSINSSMVSCHHVLGFNLLSIIRSWQFLQVALNKVGFWSVFYTTGSLGDGSPMWRRNGEYHHLPYCCNEFSYGIGGHCWSMLVVDSLCLFCLDCIPMHSGQVFLWFTVGICQELAGFLTGSVPVGRSETFGKPSLSTTWSFTPRRLVSVTRVWTHPFAHGKTHWMGARTRSMGWSSKQRIPGRCATFRSGAPSIPGASQCVEAAVAAIIYGIPFLTSQSKETTQGFEHCSMIFDLF